MERDPIEVFEERFLPLPAEKVALSSFSGSAGAFAAVALARHPPADGVPFVLAVTPGLPEADALADDIRILTARSDVRVLEFPPPLDGDAVSLGLRLRAASAIGAYAVRPYPLVLVASSPALLGTIPSAAAVGAATIRLAPHGEIAFAGLAELLSRHGYRRVSEVAEPGEFAVRGGVVDVWAPGEELPVRAEFFGDEIDDLRRFSPALQTSVEKIAEAVVPPIETSREGTEEVTLLSSLPAGCTVLWLEHVAYPRAFDAPRAARQVFTGDPAPRGVPNGSFLTAPLPGLAELGAEIARNPELLETARSRLAKHLDALRVRGAEVFERDDLSGGFETEGLAVVTRSDTVFAHRRRLRSSGAAGGAGSRISEISELEPGELVVHLDYGIGRFRGSTEIEADGRRSEVFTVEYADGALLHVPVTQAHLLSRYVGVKGVQVNLHRLDGKRWMKEKVAAQRAVQDLAASLLETQARRAVAPGVAYDVDGVGCAEFEAAFPYEETDDQAKAIAAVKDDLAAAKPMDRLLCGDAGYGKTEVAVRAAYIVAMNGRQVAVLAPTTVLAEQHFETFTQRFSGTPLRVEAVSRFQSPEARRGTLERLASGAADIVIGTHALLGASVRFKDLGLVVIDEEQRFGVRHKEHLKRLRTSADVLTMSATPIPRTLYLSMTGARDLSLLRTPPRERVAVETKIVRDSDATICAAIRHELARGGQVYALFNRVATIELYARRLGMLVPEARIDVAHGQMPAGELAEKMRRFQQGRTDVLVCTTIVESGLDIPRANTILVDRADRFGIADLYQLRGRVGRSSRQGHAYFLLPAEGSIDSDARERLAALRKHGGFGAGFNLALRDLELRGAGNLLGSEQSGHIAKVGFGLYCQLLQRTIAGLRGEELPLLVDVTLDLDFLELSPGSANPASGACLPYDYVEDEAQRMGFHKRLAEASDVATVRKLRRELGDRFGRMPKAAQRLTRLAELRVLCAEKGLRRVEVHGTKVVLRRSDSRAPSAVAHLRDGSAERKIAELFKLIGAFGGDGCANEGSRA